MLDAVLSIGGRAIGPGQPTFVIAEAGCNHENDFDRACEMVLRAAEAGADVIKFQSFTPATLVTRNAPKFWDIAGPGETQFAEFEAIRPTFTDAQYDTLVQLAREHGILFASTPSDERWADFLDELGMPLFKVASMDITHLPLIRHIARKGKPVILSTGAAYANEIAQAVDVIRKEGNDEIVLLHCVSTYPTPPAGANLGMMHDLRARFPGCVIGYSDHTVPGSRPSVPAIAVAAGANVIEKHFTFDQSRAGYDHEISADYTELRTLVQEFRFIESTLGRTEKAPTEAEKRTREWGRRSIVAAVDIPEGAILTVEMLAIKRPGTGIEPRFLDQLPGRAVVRSITADEVFTWDMLR
ncbi:MAG TPA: N-acetylneuraminate synthase family protein [Chloroflexota bacterium]|nr:N-acetylneuraminate synthase family protein [Chloroflexota bacterium]